jgi:hypothetical protein
MTYPRVFFVDPPTGALVGDLHTDSAWIILGDAFDLVYGTLLSQPVF